jgi:hypothetical protein
MQSGRWTGFLVALGVLAAAVSAHAYGNLTSGAIAGGVVEGDAPPPLVVELRDESLAQLTSVAAVGPSGPSGPSVPSGPSSPSGPQAAGPSGPPSGPSGPGTTQPNAGAGVRRLAGPDRIGTSVTVSQDAWEADQAVSVVLARADTYPDALIGVPLANAKGGPLLLTRRTVLDERVLAEINRVLAAGSTVYVLGGTGAVSAEVEAIIVGAGYPVVRYAGTDRFDTALKVAQALGSPDRVFLATGRNFSDALAAGAAAAKTGRAVLLTDGDVMPAAVQQYLTSATPVAIGGPASRANPGGASIVGTDRYDTAFKLASEYFDEPSSMGLATGENFPDGLSGGAHIASFGGPLLITPTANLHPGMAALIDILPPTGSLYLYGGTAALSAAVETQARAVVAP